MTADTENAPPSTVAANPPARSRRGHVRVGRIVTWILLIMIMFVSMFPFYWMLKEALTHNSEVFGDQGIWPQNPTLINFVRVLGFATPEQIKAEGVQSGQTLNILLDLRNSIIFTVTFAFCTVFFSSMAAYAFSRLHWRGRNVIFALFLIGLMMPPIFATLPNFVTVKNLGWIDTWPGLLGPYLLMQPYSVFFLRQFYLNIPKDIEEAAQIDGLSKWGIYWKIILPSSVAPISTLITIAAVFAWNEYLWPLLVTQSADTQLLTSALGSFVRNSPGSAPDWSGFMAAATVTVIPLVVFVLLFGKRLVNNLQLDSSGK